MFRPSFAKQASKLRAPIRTFSSLPTFTNSTSSSSPSASSKAIPSPFIHNHPSSRLSRRQQQPLQWRNATVLSRWNSTDSTVKPEAQQAGTPPSDTAAAPKSEQQSGNQNAAAPEKSKAEAELAAKQKEIIDLKDKYLRSVADYRNLQERTRREVQQSKEFAIQRFARDLLESIDNLDRALINVPQESLSDKEKNKDLVNLFDGLKMTEKVLMDTLEKHGLVRFDPIGEKFNPNQHEATFEVPMPNKEPGSVFHVQMKGFSLNGRVLRAAKVGVVKAPEAPSPEESSTQAPPAA